MSRPRIGLIWSEERFMKAWKITQSDFLHKRILSINLTFTASSSPVTITSYLLAMTFDMALTVSTKQGFTKKCTVHFQQYWQYAWFSGSNVFTSSHVSVSNPSSSISNTPIK